MASQLLVSKSSQVSRMPGENTVTSTGATRTLQLMKSVYSTHQQVKFLHLDAEVETLLLQLQSRRNQN